MKPSRNCSNCHYWKYGEILGECAAPIPTSVKGFFIRRNLTSRVNGTDCQAHRMRTVRKAAKVEQGVQQ